MRSDDVINFVVVAESRSLLAASEKLGLSQPTLSKSMARLERALGLPVIERLARGIALTEAGRVFLAHSRPAALSLQDGISAVREMRTGRAGNIRLGLGVGVPQALVVEALKPLLKDGRPSVEIFGGMSNTLSKAVAAGDCEFAVTSVPPAGAPSVEWEPVYPDPMVPIVAATHALARAERVSWQTLSRQLWVTPGQGTSVRAWFEQQFRERDVALPEQVISMRDYSVTPEFGEELGAVCLMPTSFMRVHPRARRFLVVRAPPDWRSDRYVGIVLRRSRYMSPAAERLMNGIRAVGRSTFL